MIQARPRAEPGHGAIDRRPARVYRAALMAELSATAAATRTGEVRIGDYLIERLGALGVGHVFGVPGDFVLGFFRMLDRSPLAVVNTCDEQGAGFAADAYARIKGLGAVCVTYGVGGLKVANTTGQAYAEMSPVVVISGAPGLQEQEDQPLLHHKVRFYDTQRLVFEQLTVASAVLDDPETACREIDRVLAAALTHKRPVYLELPRDMVDELASRPDAGEDGPAERRPAVDPLALRAAVDEVVERLRAARQPVAFLGVEAARQGLLDEAMAIIEQMGLPTAVTLLDKSAIGEQHPLFLGVYSGAMSRREVAEYVESADLLLLLGSLLTDVALGGGTARLDRSRFIHATDGKLVVAYHAYDDIPMADLLAALAGADLPRFAPSLPPPPRQEPWVARATPVTVERLFRRLGSFLTDDTVVIADPGDAMFGAIDLPVRRDHEFLANAFYASLGFAVPASIGAQLAAPTRRPLVLVGDGAFQMTGTELSTSIRFGLDPIVVVFDNGGYAIERMMVDGGFNDVLAWDHTRLPDLFGAGVAFDVRTEEELDQALEGARANVGSMCIIRVRLDPKDSSPATRRIAERFGRAAKDEG
jgi:indolepyruvate decarboxylase